MPWPAVTASRGPWRPACIVTDAGPWSTATRLQHADDEATTWRKGKVLTDDVLTAEVVDSTFSMASGHGVGDLRVRSTEGVSGSDSDAAVTIKADAPISAASGLGRVMSWTAAAPTATDDFDSLLRGMEEKRGERGWTAPDKQRRRGSP
jgi:hypothetical protein